MPCKIPGLECECQNRPVNLSLEPAYITWLKETGERIIEGESIIEGEVQKRIIMIAAPCSGVLAEKTIEDGWITAAGDVLGLIEDGK